LDFPVPLEWRHDETAAGSLGTVVDFRPR